ncbi:right-handed parallel beta-helix repeat-containing protein [Arthrobacter sp. GCM10027362]|uniref:right-handed parallel beta-helix repeat-containing protein n=1 Tax=Arthrobacter sp. GCM10027362 TaxID=3273379 RepID=UPI00366E0AC4
MTFAPRFAWADEEIPGVGQGGDDTAAIQAAVDAAPSGAKLRLPSGLTCNVTGYVNISKPLTVLGGKIQAGPANQIFNITAGDVHLEGIELAGAGEAGAYTIGNNLINAVGSEQDPLGGLTITGCRLHDTSGEAMRLTWLRNADVAQNLIEGVRYAGIMAVSMKDSRIHDNVVRDAFAHGGVVANSYGIALTDLGNYEAARSERVSVAGNVILNFTEWAGFDTHGGKALAVSHNVVANCKQGLAIVLGKSARVVPPQDVVVSGNYIDGAGIAGGYGISLFGKSDTVQGSGTFTGNRIVNCAEPWRTDPQPAYLDWENSSWAGNTPEFYNRSEDWRHFAVPAGGLSPHPAAPPQYRKIGRQVFLRGAFFRTGGGSFSANTTYSIPGVLPAGYRPVQDSRPAAGGTTAQNSSMALIQPSGQVRIRTGSSPNGEIWIDGVSWFVD